MQRLLIWPEKLLQQLHINIFFFFFEIEGEK